MWIINKASCFFPLLITSFSVITITRSWLYILPDIFLCILYESPFFIPFHMCQPCARPCNEIGLDASGKISQGNHCSPLTNLFPVSLTPTMSCITPTGSRMGTLNPILSPGSHYRLFVTALETISSHSSLVESCKAFQGSQILSSSPSLTTFELGT